MTRCLFSDCWLKGLMIGKMYPPLIGYINKSLRHLFKQSLVMDSWARSCCSFKIIQSLFQGTPFPIVLHAQITDNLLPMDSHDNDYLDTLLVWLSVSGDTCPKPFVHRLIPHKTQQLFWGLICPWSIIINSPRAFPSTRTRTEFPRI